MRFFHLLFLFFLSLWSCEPMRQPDSGKVRNEMRSREIVHLTQGQISERALSLGDTLSQLAQTKLNQALQSGKYSSCTEAFASVSVLADTQFQVQVRRIPLDSGRIAALKNAKEKEILLAYLYNKRNRIPLGPNLQKDGEKQFLYTRPLVFEPRRCSNCHAQAGARPFQAKEGDTTGVWSVSFTRRQVVLSFVE